MKKSNFLLVEFGFRRLYVSKQQSSRMQKKQRLIAKTKLGLYLSAEKLMN